MSQGPPTSGGDVDPQQQPAVPAQPAVPPGWYPHPTAPGWEAYWDGAAWGAETRPAQPPAPATPDPVAQEPAAAVPVTEVQEPAQEQPATAVPAAAVPAAHAPADRRSDSSLPLVLCLLGAVVAIVGSFLPMASIDVFDLADNTLVGQNFGLAVIAVAVIGAIVAAYSYLKAYRTWIVILLGVVIVAIAAYAGLVGVDDMEASGLPDLESLGGTGGQTPDPQSLETIAQAAQGGDLEPSASTGIFVTAIGGLLMLLGGLGIARQPK